MSIFPALGESPYGAKLKAYIDDAAGALLGSRVDDIEDTMATKTGTETLTGKTLTLADNTITGTKAQFNAALMDGDFAMVNSPAFTGNPTAPTPATSDNDTSLATTAFVKAQFADTVLTGNPTAPTPSDSDEDTSIATTAFVKAQGKWTTYACAWTGTTANPVLGNGSITARYTVIGKTVHYYIGLFIGSTTTLGSGRWDFSLPAPAIGYGDAITPIGTAIARDIGSRNYLLTAMYTAPDKVHVWRDWGTSEATATPTTPFTWASGDALLIMGTYERT